MQSILSIDWERLSEVFEALKATKPSRQGPAQPRSSPQLPSHSPKGGAHICREELTAVLHNVHKTQGRSAGQHNAAQAMSVLLDLPWLDDPDHQQLLGDICATVATRWSAAEWQQLGDLFATYSPQQLQVPALALYGEEDEDLSAAL